MKRVCIFIGLKVMELVGLGAAIVFLAAMGNGVTFWLPSLGHVENIFSSRSDFIWAFGNGLISLGLSILIVLALMGLRLAIKANWRKAGELARRR